MVKWLPGKVATFLLFLVVWQKYNFMYFCGMSLAKTYLGNIRSMKHSNSPVGGSATVRYSITDTAGKVFVIEEAIEYAAVGPHSYSLEITGLDTMLLPYFDFSDGEDEKHIHLKYDVVYPSGAIYDSFERDVYFSIGPVTEQMEAEAIARQAEVRPERLRRFYREFRFIGPTGLKEVMACTGSQEREGEYNPSYLNVGDDYRKVDTELVVRYKVFTGPLTAKQRDLFYFMAKSPWVWVIIDDHEVPVTILDVDVSEKEPHTQPIGLSLTYRFTDTNKTI